jgi:hypothetical protein
MALLLCFLFSQFAGTGNPTVLRFVSKLLCDVKIRGKGMVLSKLYVLTVEICN